jgi:hypothetical protein
MTTLKYCLKTLLTIQTFALLMNAPLLPAQDAATVPTPVNFDEVAGQALRAMTKRANELKIKGVALVACAEGDTVKSWSSKMVVVGNLTTGQKPDKKGNNLLGIAYSKAAEMADTLQDSGSKVRPPLNGEYGYQGGLVIKGKTGILIAAFSGGPSEDDVKVSRAGLDVLAANY